MHGVGMNRSVILEEFFGVVACIEGGRAWRSDLNKIANTNTVIVLSLCSQHHKRH